MTNAAHQAKWRAAHPDIARRRTKERTAQRIARRKRLIENGKRKPCADCMHTFPSYVMDYDHVRGKKEFNLSEAANRRISIARIEAEILKCDVVCANCHRERTHNRAVLVQW